MTFDDGYDHGYVYRLFFDHAAGGKGGAPFAYRDVVVIADEGDMVSARPATVSDKRRGSIDADAADEPTNDVRVRDRMLTVRKSAVVMKRHFGKIGPRNDLRVVEDPTGEWGTDE